MPSPAFAKPKAPVIPTDVDPVERVALGAASRDLGAGKFDAAAEGFRRVAVPAAPAVFVDWTPVPKAVRPAWKQAAQGAMDGWNAALGGEVRFKPAASEEGAAVVVLFEQSVATFKQGPVVLNCSDGRLELEGGRSVTARLAVMPPYGNAPHSAGSIGHLVAQAIGLYLGLPTATDVAGVMGPDLHNDSTPTRPSAVETRRALDLVRLRQQLLRYAVERTPVDVPRATLVVEQTTVDAGDVWKGSTAHYHFVVRNTGDAPLELEAKPSCGCTLATFDRVLAPGAAGKVDADLRTEGYHGKIVKTVELASNDPDKPQTLLQLQANVLSTVQVLPSENPTIALKDEGPTTEDLEVRFQGEEPVEIKSVVCNMPFASAKAEPIAGGTGKGYKLTITVTDQAPAGRSALNVTAVTSSTKEPQVSVNAILEKGIQVVPVAVYMGAVTPSTTLPLTQMVTLTKRSGKFGIKAARCDDPTVEVTPTALQDGTGYTLAVKYKGGWQAGPVQRTLTVETDDPRQPTVLIPLSATVLGGAK